MAEQSYTRRKFMHQSATALGASLAVSRATHAVNQPHLGANDSIGVGVIGIGGRGGYLASLFQTTPGVRLSALCDVNGANLARIAEQSEKIDPDKGKLVAKYQDFRKVIEDKSVDVVVVATNEHWHVIPALHACHAGKDVYLEKPMGTTAEEGRVLVDTVRDKNVVLQMGTQQRSWEHYHKAAEILKSGVMGEISHVETWDFDNFYPGFGAPADEEPPEDLAWDFWLGPAPKVPYNRNRQSRHYWFFDYGGGWQVAWGHHHYDIVHWLMGVDRPVSAMGMGGRFAYREDNTQWPDTFEGVCEYPPGPIAKQGFSMTYSCRAGNQNQRHGISHGKAFHGTHGSLMLDRQGFKLNAEWRNNRKVIVEDLMTSGKSEHDVVRDHIKNFISCVRSRATPFCDALVGHRSTLPGLLMNIGWRTGRKIAWDSQTERIINDAEAEKLLKKEYREPWGLKV